MTIQRKFGALGLGALLLAALAGGAQAATISNDFAWTGASFPGNDCAGALGTPPGCTWNGSPMIAKFDFNEDGTTTFTSGVFGSIDGSEFSFDIDFGGEEWAGVGSWSYAPGANDPGITAFSVKGGPGYNVFEKVSPAFLAMADFSDDWFAPNNRGGKLAGVSHIVFFDSVAPVPLPAAAWLLLGGLGALGAAARRGRKPAAA